MCVVDWLDFTRVLRSEYKGCQCCQVEKGSFPSLFMLYRDNLMESPRVQMTRLTGLGGLSFLPLLIDFLRLLGIL